MRETILKRTKSCHESRIWEKMLIGEGTATGRLTTELETPSTSVALQRNMTELEAES